MYCLESIPTRRKSGGSTLFVSQYQSRHHNHQQQQQQEAVTSKRLQQDKNPRSGDSKTSRSSSPPLSSSAAASSVIVIYKKRNAVLEKEIKRQCSRQIKNNTSRCHTHTKPVIHILVMTVRNDKPEPKQIGNDASVRYLSRHRRPRLPQRRPNNSSNSCKRQLFSPREKYDGYKTASKITVILVDMIVQTRGQPSQRTLRRIQQRR